MDHCWGEGKDLDRAGEIVKSIFIMINSLTRGHEVGS